MLENILLVVSILLIAIVLLQGNKASDGNIITGGNENLFQHQKERGLELFISRFTFALGILFFVISLVLFLK